MPEPQLEAPLDLLEKPLLGAIGNAAQSLALASEVGSRLAWLDVSPGAPGTLKLVNGLLLGAAPGSTWAIYPPGDFTFAPGRALAIATVTQLTGQHAQAKFHPAGKNIPNHSRAVALMPASAGETIPIQILDVPSTRRKHIEETLRKNIPQVRLVESEQFPRYLVTTEGSTIQLLTADGLQVVGSFAGNGDNWGASLALVVTRSATANELLTLDNPSSQLKLDVRVTTAIKSKPTVSTRGIKVVADTQAAQYRIRKPGTPRTEQNSLQLEVRVNADSYVTIVDVDSEGGVNLLFPNSYQNPTFYRDGFIHGNESVLIPDSIRTGNKAGFHWDYSPPKGTDTIRVFTSTDLQTAQMIRDRIKALQAVAGPGQDGLMTRSVSSGIQSLREELATRGIALVADSTSHLPTSTDSGLVDLASSQSAAIQLPSAGMVSPPQIALTVPNVQSSTSDWAATSVTIAIHD